MAEIDHYEVNNYGNRIYVEPKYREGCGTKIGLVVMVMILFAIFKMCSGSANENNDFQSPQSTSRDSISTAETTKPERMALAELFVYNDHSDIFSNISNSSVTDSYGNTYDGLHFHLTSLYSWSAGWNEAYTELVTGGEYMYLSGTYFVKASREEYLTSFCIYADGELVYESGPITRGTKAVDFDVCIHGAQIVKVASTASNIDSTLEGTTLYLFYAEVRK